MDPCNLLQILTLVEQLMFGSQPEFLLCLCVLFVSQTSLFKLPFLFKRVCILIAFQITCRVIYHRHSVSSIVLKIQGVI